jgi:ABC-2 type transport system permease protein
LAILYRGTGFDVVWRSFAVIAGIGSIFFIIALMRFRKTVVLT